MNSIQLESSRTYVLESNGAAERLIQENWTPTRSVLFGSKLPHELWGEAIILSNWIRNRISAKRIYYRILYYYGNRTLG